MSKYIHRVQYYETDKMGITHHSNYIRFMEEARMQYLREAGYPMTKMEAAGITSPVVSVKCDFRSPTTYDDEIEIEVAISDYTGVKLVLTYEMRRAGILVATAASSHCFIDKNKSPVALKKHCPELHDILIAEIQRTMGE